MRREPQGERRLPCLTADRGSPVGARGRCAGTAWGNHVSPTGPLLSGRARVSGAWPPAGQSPAPAADGQLTGFSRGFQTMSATMATVATSIEASRSVRPGRGGVVRARATSLALGGLALGQLARLAVEPAGHCARDAEPHDQHVGRLQPAGVVRDAQLVGQPDARPPGSAAAPCRRGARAAGRHAAGRRSPTVAALPIARSRNAVTAMLPPTNRSTPERCRKRAQSRAIRPSNVAAAKGRMPRWKPVA